MKKNPSLFLDRDGVINQRKPGGYITHPADFIPETGALEALRLLAGQFGHILVVTNQAGIGKELMHTEDLEAVHRKMRALVETVGGRLDRIYFCPHRPDAGCNCRKPGTGMPEQAKADFPDIDFSRAWMVGDSLSDMQMGQALGMKTVLIAGKFEEAEALAALEVDYRFDSLLDFATAIAREE